ncbi:MAG: phosphoribosyltransferase family protein [Gammaproteobacteria bacterium]|nr:phosphoribosyltransferase family protein [Gammaproteobacteria bacterium]
MAESARQLDGLPDGSELLIPHRDISTALDRLAQELQPVVDSGRCVLMAVMVGGMWPAIWLAERLRGDFVVDYCHVTRYRGGERGAEPEWLQAPCRDLAGAEVVLVDDIFDEGVTLDYARRACLKQRAARVTTVTLVVKRHGRAVPFAAPDHFGLEVPDRYVFGCGMDYRYHWRHLPDIHALPVAAEARA